MYARTDHHWLPLGAYYAAEAFAKTANVACSCPATPRPPCPAIWAAVHVHRVPSYRRMEDFTYYTPTTSTPPPVL
ncbi:MAG: DHHW family protein [Ruminococcus callidus]